MFQVDFGHIYLWYVELVTHTKITLGRLIGVGGGQFGCSLTSHIYICWGRSSRVTWTWTWSRLVEKYFRRYHHIGSFSKFLGVFWILAVYSVSSLEKVRVGLVCIDWQTSSKLKISCSNYRQFIKHKLFWHWATNKRTSNASQSVLSALSKLFCFVCLEYFVCFHTKCVPTICINSRPQ